MAEGERKSLIERAGSVLVATLVNGALGGFLAAWLVKLLLADGAQTNVAAMAAGGSA